MTRRITVAMLMALVAVSGLTIALLGPLRNDWQMIDAWEHAPSVSLAATAVLEPPELPPSHHPSLVSATSAPARFEEDSASSDEVLDVKEKDLVVAGVALEEDSLRPLAGDGLTVTVTVRSGARIDWRIDRRIVKTDATGRFQLRGLLPGSQRLTFAHPRFRRFVADITLGKTSIRDLEVILVSGIDAWGRVLDLDENPLEEVVVEWSQSQHGLDSREVMTDEDGWYRISGLRPRQYFVRVFPKRFRAAWEAEAGFRQVVARDGSSNRFDFTADLGSALPIVVLDAGEAGVSGIQIEYQLRTPRKGSSGFLPPTDDTGKTWLRGLPSSGTLLLAVADARGNRSARLELDLGSLADQALLRLE